MVRTHKKCRLRRRNYTRIFVSKFEHCWQGRCNIRNKYWIDDCQVHYKINNTQNVAEKLQLELQQLCVTSEKSKPSKEMPEKQLYQRKNVTKNNHQTYSSSNISCICLFVLYLLKMLNLVFCFDYLPYKCIWWIRCQLAKILSNLKAFPLANQIKCKQKPRVRNELHDFYCWEWQRERERKSILRVRPKQVKMNSFLSSSFRIICS